MIQLFATVITASLDLGPQISRTLACSLTNANYSLWQEAIRVGSYITANSVLGGGVGGSAAFLSKGQVSVPVGVTLGFMGAWVQAVLTFPYLECPSRE